MSFPRCIITGCAFVDTAYGETAWGDLFEVGDTYVFNAAVTQGETLWERSLPRGDVKQLLTLPSFASPYFERRGVIVISKSDAKLNEVAREYVAR